MTPESGEGAQLSRNCMSEGAVTLERTVCVGGWQDILIQLRPSVLKYLSSLPNDRTGIFWTLRPSLLNTYYLYPINTLHPVRRCRAHSQHPCKLAAQAQTEPTVDQNQTGVNWREAIAQWRRQIASWAFLQMVPKVLRYLITLSHQVVAKQNEPGEPSHQLARTGAKAPRALGPGL